MATSADEMNVQFGLDLSNPMDDLEPSDSVLEEYESTPEARGDVIDDSIDIDEDAPSLAEEPIEPTSGSEELSTDESTNTEDSGTAETSDTEPVAEKEPPKKIMIPKSRFDEVNGAKRVLEEENEQLRRRILHLDNQKPVEQEPEQEPTYDFATKQKDLYELILDGKTDEANTLQQEIDAEKERIFMERMRETSSNAITDAQEQAEFNHTVAALQNQFDFFNPQSPDYDTQLTQEAVVLRDAIHARGGISRSDALIAATRYILGTHKPDVLHGEVIDPGQINTSSGAAPSAERQNSKKSIAAERAQPPATAGEGNAVRDDGIVDVMSLSEEEFDALPEATKKRLRGD